MGRYHQGAGSRHCGAGHALAGYPAGAGPHRNPDRRHCAPASQLRGPDRAGSIRQRQAEGIAAAKERGVQFGRERIELPEDFPEFSRLWQEDGISSKSAARELGMSYQTFERQGLDLLPTVHEGVAVRQMELKGITTGKGDLNR